MAKLNKPDDQDNGSGHREQWTASEPIRYININALARKVKLPPDGVCGVQLSKYTRR